MVDEHKGPVPNCQPEWGAQLIKVRAEYSGGLTRETKIEKQGSGVEYTPCANMASGA